MKKLIMALSMLLCMSFAFAGKDEVSPKVLNAFKKEFSAAEEVKWTAAAGYYEAKFVFNGNHVFAFYNTEGELLGLTRYISSIDLPMNLQKNLKKNYPAYWITDLFEIANKNGTSYYITLENANTKVILRSGNGSNWKIFEKTAKA